MYFKQRMSMETEGMVLNRWDTREKPGGIVARMTWRVLAWPWGCSW